MVARSAYPAPMGAFHPWHIAVLSLCCLFVTAVIAGVAALVVYLNRRR